MTPITYIYTQVTAECAYPSLHSHGFSIVFGAWKIQVFFFWTSWNFFKNILIRRSTVGQICRGETHAYRGLTVLWFLSWSLDLNKHYLLWKVLLDFFINRLQEKLPLFLTNLYSFAVFPYGRPSLLADLEERQARETCLKTKNFYFLIYIKMFNWHFFYYVK